MGGLFEFNVKVTHECGNSVGDLFEFNVKVTQHDCLNSKSELSDLSQKSCGKLRCGSRQNEK